MCTESPNGILLCKTSITNEWACVTSGFFSSRPYYIHLHLKTSIRLGQFVPTSSLAQNLSRRASKSEPVRLAGLAGGRVAENKARQPQVLIDLGRSNGFLLRGPSLPPPFPFFFVKLFQGFFSWADEAKSCAFCQVWVRERWLDGFEWAIWRHSFSLEFFVRNHLFRSEIFVFTIKVFITEIIYIQSTKAFFIYS